MKCFLSLLSLCLVLCFSLQSPAAVLDGNDGAEGGDDIGLEFQLLARKTLRDIQTNYPEIAFRFSQDEFMFYVDHVTTLVVNDALGLILKGATQDSVAVNVAADKIIYVNRARWDKIFDQRVKAGIVLHEYLSLMGLESTGMYSISAHYMALVGAPKTPDFPVTHSAMRYNNKCENKKADTYTYSISPFGKMEVTVLSSVFSEKRFQAFAAHVGAKPEGIVGISFHQQTGIYPSGVQSHFFQTNTCILLRLGEPDLICVNYTSEQAVTFLYADNYKITVKVSARDFSVGPLVAGVSRLKLLLLTKSQTFDLKMKFNSQECVWGFGI